MALFHALRRLRSRLASDRRGAAAVEYALIIALIVLVMLASLGNVAQITINMWGYVSDRVVNAR